MVFYYVCVNKKWAESSVQSAVPVSGLQLRWPSWFRFGSKCGPMEQPLEKHQLVFTPSVIFTWPLLFFFFFLFGSQGTLCYGERLYLHKLMEINFACLVGILDRNSQMMAQA